MPAYRRWPNLSSLLILNLRNNIPRFYNFAAKPLVVPQRCSSDNRDDWGLHDLEELLGDVAAAETVLKGQIKLVLGEELGHLPQVSRDLFLSALAEDVNRQAGLLLQVVDVRRSFAVRRAV